MMNVQGKSDPPIVPAKSPNNAASAAAEAMEGRGGAKGNAGRSPAALPSCGQIAPKM